MATLFTNFTKIMENRQLNREGVGLGLTISKNIANALGGELEVKSKINKGSKFILSLPIQHKKKLN
jgi:K+-sensing histidine kinase KdpD